MKHPKYQKYKSLLSDSELLVKNFLKLPCGHQEQQILIDEIRARVKSAIHMSDIDDCISEKYFNEDSEDEPYLDRYSYHSGYSSGNTIINEWLQIEASLLHSVGWEHFFSSDRCDFLAEHFDDSRALTRKIAKEIISKLIECETDMTKQEKIFFEAAESQDIHLEQDDVDADDCNEMEFAAEQWQISSIFAIRGRDIILDYSSNYINAKIVKEALDGFPDSTTNVDEIKAYFSEFYCKEYGADLNEINYNDEEDRLNKISYKDGDGPFEDDECIGF